MNRVENEITEYIKQLKASNTPLVYDYKGLDNITKEVKKIDGLLSSVENYEDIIQELRLNLRITKDGQEKIVYSLINILDSIDWLIDASLVFTNTGLEKSINVTREILKRELETLKLTSTPNVGDLFNENYHFCLGYKSVIGLADNQIAEVIKKGYIYKEKIFREAEVIVVKNSVEDKYESNRD